MNFADISIKRPVLVVMLMAALVIFGAMAYLGMPLNITPNIDIPYILVQVTYPGASPDLIETEVSKKVEDAVATISGLKKITSYSLENVSLVMMEFKMSKDVDTALLEVTNKINNISEDMPDAAKNPVIFKLNLNEMPIFQVIIAGDEGRISPTALFDLADKDIKNRFSQIDGVGQTRVLGGHEREIHVELDNRVVFQNQISLMTLNNVLAASNLKLPGGYFQNGGQDFTVKFDGEFKSVESIGELEVPTGKGMKKLRDIATISDTSAKARERTVYMDLETGIKYDNAVLMQVTKTSEGNAVAIQEELEKAIADINRELPDGVQIFVAAEATSVIRGTVDDTVSNVIMGIAFTAMVLLLFLHSYRSTVIAAITMPISILPTFFVMKALGYSLNIMSLMGISTAVGVLVMNSVVILENIFRLKNMGYPGKIAASRGTSEVVLAVLASTLTNVAVFLPIGTMSGIAGKFLVEFAMSVVIATLFSLLVAFTLTPMMAAYMLPDKDTRKHPIGDRIEAFFHKLEIGYEKMVGALLKTKLRSGIFIAAILGLFIFSMSLFKFIPFEFMPVMDNKQVDIEIELPKGYDLTETAKITEIIEERLKVHSDDITHISTSIGALSQMETGVSMAKMYLRFIPRSQRKYHTQQYAGIITKELSDIPSVTIRAKSSSMNSQASSSPVDFYLKGSDMAVLQEYQEKLLPEIQKIPGIMNLTTSNNGTVPEITVFPDMKKITDAGTSIQELAYTVRTALAGIDDLTNYKDNGEEYDIKVILKDDNITSIEDLGNINIATSKGVFPIYQLADIRYTKGFSKIMRSAREKGIEFTADVASGYNVSAITDQIQELTNKLDLPYGYKYEVAGDTEEMNETVKQMLVVFVIAIVLTYMLLAAILENYWQPVLILLTIPLALIGVVFVYLYLGKAMNFIGMMSIVMLVGMVVNNAILILDFANQLCAKGNMTMKDALITACPTKLKAILMSNIATILGMLPMALGLGDQGAEMRQPMGIVSISGLITSTILTLFVIPATQYLVTTKNTKLKNRGFEYDKLVAEFNKKNPEVSELAGENK